jgi:hypothetical protein
MLSFCTQVYDWYNVHHHGYTRVRPKSVRSAGQEVLGPGRNRNLRHKRALGSPPVPHDHRDSNLAGKSTSQTALGSPPVPHNHRDGKLPEKIFDKRRRRFVSEFFTDTDLIAISVAPRQYSSLPWVQRSLMMLRSNIVRGEQVSCRSSWLVSWAVL